MRRNRTKMDFLTRFHFHIHRHGVLEIPSLEYIASLHVHLSFWFHFWNTNFLFLRFKRRWAEEKNKPFRFSNNRRFEASKSKKECSIKRCLSSFLLSFIVCFSIVLVAITKYSLELRWKIWQFSFLWNPLLMMWRKRLHFEFELKRWQSPRQRLRHFHVLWDGKLI